jgi:hypothetical protein
MDFNFGVGPLKTNLSGKEAFELMKKLQESNQFSPTFGPGIVGPSHPVLSAAVDFRSKPVPAMLSVADSFGAVADVWSGNRKPDGKIGERGYHFYKPNDIVMNYGNQPLDHVGEAWREEARLCGVTEIADQAVSTDPELMKRTYVNAHGDYLIKTGELEMGKPPVKAIKQADARVLVVDPKKYNLMHTIETIGGGIGPSDIIEQSVIMVDHRGPYRQPVDIAFKKNIGLGLDGERVQELFGKFIKLRNEIMDRVKANLLPEDIAKKEISELWQSGPVKFYEERIMKMFESLPGALKRIK